MRKEISQFHSSMNSVMYAFDETRLRTCNHNRQRTEIAKTKLNM